MVFRKTDCHIGEENGTGLASAKRKHVCDRLILVLVALLFAERLLLFFLIGPDAVADGDDVAYIRSGIVFARTGVVSVWEDCPTALIMPGTTLVTGALSLLFGEGVAYLSAVKLLWMLLGSLSALYLYRALRLYIPPVFALCGAACLLMPNRAWMDTIISTETPYTFFFLANFYYMLRLRDDKSLACTLRYTLSFLLALAFRANIVVMPAFALVYLLCCRRWDRGLLLRRGLLFLALTALCLMPWTVRNYRVFDAFIPVSYGAGNPTLKGSYQGAGAPKDEDLDYETNVEAVIREKYARYFDGDGECQNDSHAQYVRAMADSLKAKYRMREWFSRDRKGFLRAYLVDKPLGMLTWIYYWGPWAETVIPFANFLSKLNFLLCALGVLLAFLLREKREITAFLCAVYWVNLYIIGLSYAVERYAALLMPVRYMVGAVALYLLARASARLRTQKPRSPVIANQ